MHSSCRLLIALSAFAVSFLAAQSTSFAVSDGKMGAMCGGIAGFQCADGLFCDFPVAAQCGAADQAGTCSERPQICTKIYQPVCGCDGKTYGNDCERKSAGMAKQADGACEGAK